MTREERVKKLRCFITCMKCELSGKVCNENCSTQYDAGNIGEIIENLEEIAKALEQEPILDKIRAEIIQSIQNGTLKIESGNEELFNILDKYKTESETQ